jgi:hypothetical protein
MKKQTQQCTGEPLFNKHAMGGHVEDYCLDANPDTQHIPYAKKMEWVPVSQSFKKD